MTAPFRLRPPVPLERDIHENCARVLDTMLLPPALWFTYPAGAAQLSPAQQARYSRIGLKRGLPDIFVLHGYVYGIELKRPGSGRLSRSRIVRTRRGSPYVLLGQEEMFERLVAAGVREIAIATSVTEMLGHLERWRIPLRGTVAA